MSEAKEAYGTAVLRETENGLELTDGRISIRADFTAELQRLKPSNLNRELLVKAARIKGFEGTPTVFDATAGFGEDSLLLAAAGFRVTLCERDPVIAALLKDALRRASGVPELKEIAGRMRLMEGDSLILLPLLTEAPDVILLDPMFPERRKSALVHKKFQLLQQLEKPCTDEEAEKLLRAAMEAGPGKIVIKRPLKGPFLAGVRPGYSLTGKTIRYDCIVLPRG
jgi:16S rRNA (guanine1516-N2)-methyltransferase